MTRAILAQALLVATMLQFSISAQADFDGRQDQRWGHHPGRPGGPGGVPGGYPGGPGYPGRPGPGYPPERPRPPGPPPGQYPGGQLYQGSIQINAVTRRPGGAWYRVSLYRPLVLSNLEFRVLRANLRFHETALVTERGFRIPVYELSNTPMLGQGGMMGVYVNRNERIVAIDIRTESFGDYADLLVTVMSPEYYPQLSVIQY